MAAPFIPTRINIQLIGSLHESSMPTILLISRNPDFRESLQRNLQTAGRTFMSLASAHDILHPQGRHIARGYDLIVAEVRTDDHDGLTGLVLLRQLHATTSLIAVTQQHGQAGADFAAAAARTLRGRLCPLLFDSHEDLRAIVAQELSGESPTAGDQKKSA
ncbi:MAG: hypothetical protein U0412_08745 [Nitrospira sp.]